MAASGQRQSAPEPREPYWVRKPGVTVSVCLAALVILFSLYLLVLANQGRKYAQVYRIMSSSMEPTLKIGELVSVRKDVYKTQRPRRGDIVAFQSPSGDAILLKRVIAIGGDTISGTPHSTRVNGQDIYEPYVNSAHPEGNDDSSQPFPEETFGPIRVPPDSFFVMGDNRDDSYDSRFPAFGFVPLDRIRGKAVSVGNNRIQMALSKGRALH